MSSGTDGSPTESAPGSFARGVLSAGNLVMALAGVLAGASLGVLGEEAVVVPLVGATSGTAVGAAGLVIALAVYRQGSCRGTCGSAECGCSGECGDSCSHDP